MIRSIILRMGRTRKVFAAVIIISISINGRLAFVVFNCRLLICIYTRFKLCVRACQSQMFFRMQHNIYSSSVQAQVDTKHKGERWFNKRKKKKKKPLFVYINAIQTESRKLTPWKIAHRHHTYYMHKEKLNEINFRIMTGKWSETHSQCEF